MREDKEILVHACCGPCSTASIERLLRDGWKPTMFYSDSNIYPAEEFDKRGRYLKEVCSHYGVPLIVEAQDHDAWRKAVSGLEREKEGGARCLACYRYNLERTFLKAKELGFAHFCTTLTVSRFKKSASIFSVGESFEGFEPIDFKKQDGFARSCLLSKQLGLYRQQYCGCEFSQLSSVAPV